MPFPGALDPQAVACSNKRGEYGRYGVCSDDDLVTPTIFATVLRFCKLDRVLHCHEANAIGLRNCVNRFAAANSSQLQACATSNLG